MEPEVINDVAIANIDTHDLSGENKPINYENSSLDKISSNIPGSFDKTYQMEIHLSAPRNQKLAVPDPGHDTSCDYSQSSASTDAEVGNNRYFSKFELDSNSQQLASLPEMFIDEDNATLSDISPISDFAALPQLPADDLTPDNDGHTVSKKEDTSEMVDNDKLNNTHKFVSFSVEEEEEEIIDNLTHDNNWNRNDKTVSDHTNDSVTDIKVGNSYHDITADNEAHYNDDQLSDGGGTHMNRSTDSSDNSKMESSESSLRNVVIYFFAIYAIQIYLFFVLPNLADNSGWHKPIVPT